MPYPVAAVFAEGQMSASLRDGNNSQVQPYQYRVISRFLHPISMYMYPPFAGDADTWMPVHEFENVVASRLKVLYYIDQVFGLDTSLSWTHLLNGNNSGSNRNEGGIKSEGGIKTEGGPKSDGGARSGLNKSPNQILENMLLEGGLMIPPLNVINMSDQQRAEFVYKDAVSHFALRMAYSKDKDKQQWFIRQETRLFSFRLDSLSRFRDLQKTSEEFFAEFLHNEGMNWTVIERVKDEHPSSQTFQHWKRATAFRDPMRKEALLYIVPCFPDAGPLVRNRRVYVSGGMAYVLQSDLPELVINRFKGILSESFRALDLKQDILQQTVFSDERIGELLKAAPNVYIGKDFTKSSQDNPQERLTLQAIQNVWKESFPPCMRRLYFHYIREKHLKHSGRMQLWLFFKGAGLSLDDNIRVNRNIWKDATKFDKEHTYNIRHMYGQEGKRVSFTPLSCSSITSGSTLGPPGSGDFHGCPFKHFDSKPLEKMFQEWGLNYKQIQHIAKYKETNEFQLACREFFVQTHPGSTGDDVGNHPNAFFASSRRYRIGQKSGQSAKPSGPEVTAPVKSDS